MSKPIDALFRKIIILNELGADLDEALRFSDPDGIRSGKSGWSFGAVQFDTKNNDQAIACLREIGFTEAEIKGVVNQTIDVTPLNKRLAENAGTIIEYDNRQLVHCLRSAERFSDQYRVPLADSAALLALADTVNQYGSLGAGSAAKLLAPARPVTAADILAMKLTWKYAQEGKRQHDDTVRRHNNIMQIMETV